MPDQKQSSTSFFSGKSALLLLHVIVFIWGFTGILGKEISLDAFHLVWWRMAIALAAIGIFAMFAGSSLRSSRKEILQFLGVGLITAIHWICFFAAIKVSNVSTALAVISTTSFFMALVAPVITRSRFLPYELLLGIIVITGLLIIFKFESRFKLGIVLSLCAALAAAVFSSFNSNFVKKHSPIKIAFYEMLIGVIALPVFFAFTGKLNAQMFTFHDNDIFCLLVLGVVATAFAFIAGIEVMKTLSPFTCALTINLEPIYTIAFALLLYGEDEFMSPQFYLGAAIILSTLFADVWLKRRLLSSKG